MDTQNLLYNASQMPLTELEAFVQQLNSIITRKKTTDKNTQDSALLDRINRTVLDKTKRG